MSTGEINKSISQIPLQYYGKFSENQNILAS